MTKYRLFGACRVDEHSDCVETLRVGWRRDGEPAVTMPVHDEVCSCDCHNIPEELPSPALHARDRQEYSLGNSPEAALNPSARRGGK